MAVDAGLMARARDTRESVFRVYEWSRPTLSFGRHEAVRGRFDRATLTARGYDAVRRPTGGRVLLHDGDVTYSVTAPTGSAEPMRAAFTRINAVLADALHRLGIDAAPAIVTRRERSPGHDACFAAPSAGELVVADRKLVASAQRQEGGALLQHGSILLVDRQRSLVDLAVTPMPTPAPAATVEGALGRSVERAEVYAALRAALETAVGRAEPLAAGEAIDCSVPFVSKYADSEWTWRR